MRKDEFPIIEKFVHQEINQVLEDIKEEILDLTTEPKVDISEVIRVIDKHIGKEGGAE